MCLVARRRSNWTSCRWKRRNNELRRGETKSTSQVGKERLVSERVIIQQAKGAAPSSITKEQIIESQVCTGVIRRRTTRIEVPQEPVARSEEKPEQAQSTSSKSTELLTVTAPVAFELLSPAEPLSFVLPRVPETPAVPTFPVPEGKEAQWTSLPEATPQTAPAPAPQKSQAASLPGVEARTEATREAARPSRILGRIDLKPLTALRQPARRVDAKPTPVVVAVEDKKVGTVSGAEVAKKQPAKHKSIRMPQVSERGAGLRCGRSSPFPGLG